MTRHAALRWLIEKGNVIIVERFPNRSRLPTLLVKKAVVALFSNMLLPAISFLLVDPDSIIEAENNLHST